MKSVSSPAAEPHNSRLANVIAKYGQALVTDKMYLISTARVFLVNYERLLADFPQLRPHALLAINPELRALGASEQAMFLHRIVDQWLVESAALISEAQTGPSDVNTSIVTESTPRNVFRPPRYGRACIAEVTPMNTRVQGLKCPVLIPGGGELDIKGVGVGKGHHPIRGDYSDGLISVPDALQEYLVERLLNAIFVHAGAKVRTLPYYGIIDTGFDGLTPTGRYPAGIIVRRAHMRDLYSDLPRWDSEDHYLTVRTELLLRRYGITSSNWKAFEIRMENGKLGVYSNQTQTKDSHALISCLVEYLDLELPFVADRINIQMDADDEAGVRHIVDLGHYWARTCFDRPLVSLVSDRPMAWGGMVVPADAAYVHPDPSLVPKGRLWEGGSRPQSRPFGRFASEVAASFRLSELDHVAVNAQAAAVLDEVTSAWPPSVSSPDSAADHNMVDPLDQGAGATRLASSPV